MKIPMGPHQRRGRRRRRGKALALCAIAGALAAVSSWTTWDKPEEEYVPSASELAYMRNIAALSPGHRAGYLKQYPKYAAYILGEKEIPSGGTQTGED